MSKFNKYSKKPNKVPKKGFVLVSNANLIFELGDIFEKEGERVVNLIVNNIEVEPPFPVRDVIQNIRNGTWLVIKDGPIEPEKFLKQFNFI